MLTLRPFQRRFLRAAFAPGIRTSALSLPRGNGKTTLAAHILSRCLTPGDPWCVAGAEYLLGAASIEQARYCYAPIRTALEPTGEYRFLDSSQRIGITHKSTNTRLRVISSSGKRAMGVVGVPLWVMDEPGSFEVRGGELMHDAAQTAQGKPGSKLRVLYIGTLAPATGGWWHDLVADGSNRSTHVTALKGNAETWDQWPTIRRCNPLVEVDADFRRTLLEERDEARADTRLKARFMSYRLNLPSADESEVLLTVDDWQRVVGRPVAAPEGLPIFAYDLGGGRAWSAAVAMWRNGRVEALAVAPGIPGLDAQEKRDRVPAGTYRKLADSGSLRVAEGLRVQPPAHLHAAALEAWGRPQGIVCDRFRLDELRDVVKRVPVVPRVTRWSDASADIRALRKAAKDGPLNVEKDSRALIAASLAAALVQNDDAGNHRLVKHGTNNTARDDVAAALTLAAGLVDRMPKPRTGPMLHVVNR